MPVFLAHGPAGICQRIVRDEPLGSGGLLAISKPVGRNCSNRFEDVRTIQDALNQVPPVEGGPTPKLKVDGLCWGKTTAAIDRFQRVACGFKWPDGKVDPGGKTHARLQQFFLLPSPYTLMTIHYVLPQARVWIFRARSAIATARSHFERGISSREVLLLEKYFHLTKLQKPKVAEALTFMDKLYGTMEEVLNQSRPDAPGGAGYFIEDPKNNVHNAYTFEGGFRRGPILSHDGGYTTGPNVRIDRIYVCPRKLNNVPSEAYTVVVVHELAHFCGGPLGDREAVIDHGYRRKPGFFDLAPEKALRTADCYAHFAGQITLDREPAYV